MIKKIGLVVAAAFALTVVLVGANTYACGGKNAQKASNGGSCGTVQTASAGCGTESGAKMTAAECAQKCANMSAAEKAACSQSCTEKAKMTSAGSCSGKHSSGMANQSDSKGFYAANVYAVDNGKMWAVYDGRKFEVSDKTPYTQVGNARYYFADDACKVSCQMAMSQKAPEIERETVTLATTDGNVVRVENGQKIASCPVTGKEFVVTADSPVRVMDGKRYYLAAAQTAQSSH